MRTSLYFAWLYALLLACGKKEAPPLPPDPVPPVVDNTPVQYGVPYAAVPDPVDAVIYQVNLRAFSATGNFMGVKDRLDSIRALGVNVIYLMPVYPIGVDRSVNSPYCVKDFTGVNAEFGTLDDLRALVAAAHEKQMAVLFDWVANHSSWDNGWMSDKSWYTQDASGHVISPLNTGWNDVADLNYNNMAMRQAMIKAMKYWVYAANIDGYRCDAADFVPADFWKQAIDSLRNISSHKLLMLAEGTRVYHFAAGFQLKYAMGFYYQLSDNIYGHHGSVQSIDSVNAAEYVGANAAAQVVRYTSNHDINNSAGTPLDLLGGMKGSMAAFVVAAYMKGIPMIYDGQEVGCPVKLNFFNNSTKIDWSINPGFKAEYKRVIHLRNSSAVIRTGALQSYSNADVCAFTKTLNDEEMLVIVNLRNSTVLFHPEVDWVARAWKDAYEGTNTTLDANLSLQPYQYLVLQKP